MYFDVMPNKSLDSTGFCAWVLPLGFSVLMVSPPVNRNFELFAMCTFGTNHVYFYGENSLDPLIKRWTDTNAYRLRYTSHQASTVIWVRLLERQDTKP